MVDANHKLSRPHDSYIRISVMSTSGFGCSSGGEFYVCGDTTRFLGCCTSDACSSERSCPQDSLRTSIIYTHNIR